MARSEFAWILEEAKKQFEESMNWIDFSNMFFERGSKYLPADEEERDRYLSSPEFDEIMNMKFELEKQQQGVTKPEYSGKTVIRLPKSVHRDLAAIAEKEGVSLNQIMVVFLSQSVVRYRQS